MFGKNLLHNAFDDKDLLHIETQQNIKLVTFAVTWYANIFVGRSVTPTQFFFQQITSFSDSFIILKKKNSVRGKF